MEIESKKKQLKRLKIQNIVLILILLLCICRSSYLSIEEIRFKNQQKYYSPYYMSVQEIEAFNSQFTVFGGLQKGAKIKSLLETLIANANTYNEEGRKIPKILQKTSNNLIIYEDSRIKGRAQVKEVKPNAEMSFIEKFFDEPDYDYEEYKKDLDKIDDSVTKGNAIQEYIEELAKIISDIDNKSEYDVDFEYKENGLIDIIIITEKSSIERK